jgi:hypothetical protein
MTQNPKARRVVVGAEPAVQPPARAAVLPAMPTDMVDGQELHRSLAAARTRRIAVAVMDQGREAQALVLALILQSPLLGIGLAPVADEDSLAGLAHVLEAAMRHVVPVEVFSRQGQFAAADGADTCGWGGAGHHLFYHNGWPHEKPGPNQIGVRTLCRSHLPVLPAYPILRAYVAPYALARAHSPAANPHDRRSIHADALRPLAGAVVGCHNASGVSNNAPLAWRVGYADPIRLSPQGDTFLGDSL